LSDVFIGRYRVIEELGRGGMGIVYSAEDPALDRPVAIKVLPPKKLSQQKAVKRFLREARVCARLDHPNIIKIHDIGEEEGIYHIVMELVEGRSLRELIEERNNIGEVSIDYMVELFLQTCQALAYAHSKQVIHRDIKPDNIMINSEDRVKVMDFGLAVLGNRHSLTEMGQVMGTVAYFSPEQAKGEPGDHRSDIYSLGAVFFEMLTNQLVFQAKNPAEMISKQLTSPPPNPKTFNPAVPPVLSNLVLHLLRKIPEERPQDVDDVIRVLEDWQNSKRMSSKSLDSHASSKALLQVSAAPSPDTIKRIARAFESGFIPHSIAPGQAHRGVEPPPVNDLPSSIPDVPVGGSFARGDFPAGGSFAIPAQAEPSFHPDARQAAPQDLDRTHHDVTRIPVIPKEAPPPERIPMVVPTSGASPVASPTWIKDAEKDVGWDRYRKVLDQLKKDDAYAKKTAGAVPSVACPRCGAENEGSRRYCHECGGLISRLEFISQKQCFVHNDAGKQLMQEARYREAAEEFQKAIEKYPGFVDAHMNLAKALAEMGEYANARASYREAARLAPDDPKPHMLAGDLYRMEERREDAIYEYREAAKIAPSNVSIRNQLALLYAQMGDVERAIDEYQRILSVDENSIDSHRQLGYLFMSRERIDEAIREFEWVMDRSPGDSHVSQLLGGLYIKKGRFRNAEMTFQTVLEDRPDDAQALASLGQLYDMQNRPDLALENLSHAIRLDPGNIDARKKLAELYTRQQRPDLAKSELESAVQFHPEDPELHKNLGDAYLKDRQIDLALQHYEKTVEMAPGSAELHHKLAQLYDVKDYSDLSINEFKKATDLEPYKPEYREDLSMALYTQKRLDEAATEMRKAATLDSTNVEYKKALGVMYEENDQLDQAEKVFVEVIKINPKDAMAQGMLGRIYSKRGLLSMAVLQYQKALSLNPGSHLFHVYLGKVLSQQGRLEEAAQVFKKAIELAPGGEAAKGTRVLAKAYTDLGKVFMDQGEYQKAMDVLKSAVQNNPGDVAALHYLGVLSADLGQTQPAQDYLSKALKLEPQNHEIMRDLADVYRERGDLTMALSLIKKSMSLGRPTIETYEVLARTLSAMDRNAEALQTLSDAMMNCPKERDYVYWLRGSLAAGKKAWASALDNFNKAIEVNGAEWRYYRDLALALDSSGDREGAVEQLDKALQQKPGREDAEKIQAALEKMRKEEKKGKGFFGRLTEYLYE
jgi:tetratricopeptide (TPR) repeat protein/serine/threonine protein kinase